jgi:hypothetical protein
VAWDSSIFLRVDETRVDVIKALITGPEGTPYVHLEFILHRELIPHPFFISEDITMAGVWHSFHVLRNRDTDGLSP